ncbi:MAG: hypothetical protein HN341_18115 [Verrucomicrobia bacterium]|jgi:hypothetical protein|nr:hypothetical protein [Verrucomicrobiota bacterium]
MARRRVYVAIGSTAIESMAEVIGRCREEHLPDPDTTYIGIDSDQGRLDGLALLDDPSRGRVKVFKMALEADDPTSSLVRSFRPRWKGLRIPKDGVAGDRRLSFTCLNWTKQQDFTSAVENLSSDDELILMGTSFGGTSTGAYWNLAYWLRSIITSAAGRRGDANRVPAFYSLLALPAPPSSAATDYPLAPNVCGFMQDMQIANLCERIQREEDIPFKALAFSRYNGGDLLELWDPNVSASGQSSHAYLPTDHIFLVPTPSDVTARVQETMAEQAFLLGPMELWHRLKIPGQIVDNGPGGERRAGEEQSFGGFHMIAARSGKNTVLKKHYGMLLETRWKSFFRGVASANSKACSWATAVLSELMEKTSQSFPQKKVLSPFEQLLQGQLDVVENKLEAVLVELVTTIENHPYRWPAFSDLVNALSGAGEIPGDLCLADVANAYNGRRESLESAARSVDAIKNTMRRNVKKARTLSRQRKKSRVARCLDSGELAEIELKEQLQEAMSELAQNLVIACRSLQTVPSLTPSVSLDAERRLESHERVTQYTRDAMGDDAVIKRPGFIVEGTSGEVDLSKLGIRDSALTSTILKAVRARDAAAFDDVVSVAQKEAIAELTHEAYELQAANPLKAMNIKFGPGEAKPFANVFQFAECGKLENVFYVQMGTAGPLSWGDLVKGFSIPAFGTLDRNHVKTQTFDPTAHQPQGYCGVKDENSQTVHGVWLGTLKLNNEIGSVLKKVYSAQDLNNWQLRVARDMSTGGGSQNRLLSMREFVALGCALGAVETGLNSLLSSAELTVAAALSRSICLARKVGDEEELFAQQAQSVNECFSPTSDGSRLVLQQIPLHWVVPLMQWIGGSFWDDVGMSAPGAFGEQLELEVNVLTQIQLQVPSELREHLTAMTQRLNGIVIPRWANER